jgi:pimeloyl-ACP methyl ester carboxylesterase
VSWRQRLSARIIDGGMCAMMYGIQRRHRLHAASQTDFARYIAECAPLSRDAFFHGTPIDLPEPASSSHANPAVLTWPSPITTAYPENNRTQVLLFPTTAAKSETAPTAMMLHALMSASDRGYRRWAALFNAAGWNACFVHLPYHYSRTPAGHRNGELAITADCIRNGEGLRQGVSELRQLMGWLRARGSTEFGLWACSYGGWIGALLASVERDFRFIALIEPIVDVGHAIWESPTGLALRRELLAHGIPPDLIEGHFPLICPSRSQPLCDPARILFAAGEYDSIARAEDIRRLHEQWTGSSFLTQPQGHFGYRLMPAAWDWLLQRKML